MRISCPICGSRDSREFRILGEAGRPRPDDDIASGEHGSQLADFIDYVYRRDSLPGPMREFWFHSSGCKAWLIVSRNLATHEVLKVELAAEARS